MKRQALLAPIVLAFATIAPLNGTAVTQIPQVGASCAGSGIALQSNLPLGSTDRQTEVVQIWRLIAPTRPGSTDRMYVGWAFQNRSGNQFVAAPSATAIAALENYNSKLPKAAQINMNGLPPTAIDPIGKPGLNQQFLAMLLKRHMAARCFARNLP